MPAVIGHDIDHALRLLEQGELVAIPTETVYGLAGNALDPIAVARIFTTKDRPRFDPLIVHVASMHHARRYAREFPRQAEELARRFWPGPLTLLLPKDEKIPDLVTAGLPRVGLRCPAHPITNALLAHASFPLAAPSANPFGYVSPTTPQHVYDQLGDKISYILDGGPCRVGIESTILGWEDEQPVVYRLGGVGIEQLESVIGKVVTHTHSSSQPHAPGQLKSHYAPRKKFYIGEVSELLKAHARGKIGILTFGSVQYPGVQVQLTLSSGGDLAEAARNLFAMLRTLDDADVDVILAEEVPNQGLGRAINDRLRRAAAEV